MADLKNQNQVADLTLAEYGRWHRLNKPVGNSEVFLAKEMLYGSGKHYFWFADPSCRITLDATQGGSIGDFRPYAGKVSVSTGPDTPHRDIASYPYLIQSQHRSGNAHHYNDGARSTLLITHGSETLDLCNFRTKVASLDHRTDETRVELAPIGFAFDDGLSGTLVTRYHFSGNGGIHISRAISSLSESGAVLELAEYFKGAPGRTEYPEDLHGIVLEMDGESPQRLDFDYSGQWQESAGARWVSALVPQVNSLVTLSVEGEDCLRTSGAFCAGHLFSPYFTLKLTQTLQGNGTIQSCLKLTPSAM
jgi:hypothetical protein